MSYCKIVKNNIYKTVILVLLFFIAFSLTIYVMHTNQATGSTADNISGYAWSENIGWISFNCTDPGTCGSVDYGVSLNEASGNFSGYAWSENIGWISFNPADVAGCPSAPCRAKLASDDTISGWAKVLSADGLDWDGWIRLSDTSAPSYGVTFNPATDKFEGYAWGGDVVGWVSFNCIDAGTCGVSDYAVVYSPSNNPPTVGIAVPANNTSSLFGTSITFTAWGNDTDGNIAFAEWRDYGGMSNTGDCSGGVSLSSNLNVATGKSTFDIDTLGVGTHYICIRVWDDKGAQPITPPPKVKVNITASSQCSNGGDDDGDIWFDDGLVGPGEDLTQADPACYDVTTTPPTYHFDYNDESDDPECSDGIDNDLDGLWDIDDPGCHTDGDPLDGDDTYNKFDDSEGTCGDDVCDIGETFQTCPEDCDFTIEPF